MIRDFCIPQKEDPKAEGGESVVEDDDDDVGWISELSSSENDSEDDFDSFGSDGDASDAAKHKAQMLKDHDFRSFFKRSSIVLVLLKIKALRSHFW